MRSDRAVGLVLAGLGLALLIASRQLPVVPGYGLVDSRFVPTCLALIILGGGILLAVLPGQRDLRTTLRELLQTRALLLALAFLLYAGSFRYVDFRLGTAVFVFATMLIMGARRPLELLITPVVVALTVFAIFRYGFTVLLPTWT